MKWKTSLHQRHHLENEKLSHSVVENICDTYKWQMTHTQNIKTTKIGEKKRGNPMEKQTKGWTPQKMEPPSHQ